MRKKREREKRRERKYI